MLQNFMKERGIKVMDSIQINGELPLKEKIGQCEYMGCKKDAFYEINFGCDDMTAIVCNHHHNVVLALFGLPDCEGE